MEREEDRLLCSRCPFGGRCDEPPPGGAAFPDLDGRPDLAVAVCPRRHVQTRPLPLDDPFAWAARLEHGVMPEAGGWLDQPNLYVETMELTARLVAESRQRWRRRSEEQAESLRRAGR